MPGWDREAFGDRLATARIRAEFSQARLARLAGKSRASVANIEAGRQMPGPDTIVLFAEALGVSPGWLFVGEGSPAGGVVTLSTSEILLDVAAVLQATVARVTALATRDGGASTT